MSREYRTNLGQLIINIKSSQSAHPLICVVNNLILQCEIVIVETLNHQSCCIREHRSLVVIAIGVERINAVVFPQPSIYIVLLFEVRIKIYQNCYWLARNSPSAHPNLESLIFSLPLPISKEGTFLLEIRTLILFPKIRTDEDYLIPKCLLQSLGTCRKYCIDSSNFIADLPTRFKDVVWSQLLFYHVILTNCAQRYLIIFKFHNLFNKKMNDYSKKMI